MLTCQFRYEPEGHRRSQRGYEDEYDPEIPPSNRNKAATKAHSNNRPQVQTRPAILSRVAFQDFASDVR